MDSLHAQNKVSAPIQLPDFQLMNLNGEIIQNKDLLEKVVVIDFWATWCAPCIKSFPSLIEVQQSYRENKDVVFLYVNTLEVEGRDEGFLRQFLEKRGIDISVYMDRAKHGNELFSEKLGISTLPYKIIIDKSGDIRYRDMGFLGEPGGLMIELSNKINSLLTP